MAQLFSMGAKKRPPPEAVKELPMPDDSRSEAARRRRLAMDRQASGFRSAQTLNLPGSRETLG